MMLKKAAHCWQAVLVGILVLLPGSFSLAQMVESGTPPGVPILSLFGPLDTPENVNWNDHTSVEVGVKFQSAALGKVLGIRFYKGPLNIGPHVGSLWGVDGTLLGQAAFTNETVSGWQEIDFPEPVLLTPGTTYIASYHTNGFYAATNGYFGGAHINGPLSAPASGGNAGGNGVYSYDSCAPFPSTVFFATNYWVDIAFALSIGSLFNPDDVPTNVTWDDPSPAELGVRFQSSVAGFVTGVQFYKGPQNTGTHVGNLWSSTGTLLATATFTGETDSGWQVASFNNPVPIAADTIYVVSYHTSGFYSADPGYFTSDHSNGPLLAPASGGNGVYARGASSSFPSASFGATNYWVDLIFTLQAPGGP
jgi:Domain of unknown function (DUF4082)